MRFAKHLTFPFTLSRLMWSFIRTFPGIGHKFNAPRIFLRFLSIFVSEQLDFRSKILLEEKRKKALYVGELNRIFQCLLIIK